MILPDILRAAVQHYGARVAIRDAEGDLTWSALADRVARTATCLADVGLKPGGRFAVISLNTFRAGALFWAGYWMGSQPVPINWRLAPREIAHILKDAGCHLVIVDPEFAGLLADECLAPWRGGALIHAPPGTEAGLPNLEDGLVTARGLAPHEGCEDDDAILLYTGGTTGRAKGVRLTHRNVIANGQQNGFALGIRFDDVWLHAAPMFHSADLLATPCTLMGGGHVYLPQFSPAALLDCLQERRPSATVLPPTMLRMVMDAPDFEGYDISSLRLLYYGSSPMAASWISEAMERFPGVEIFQGYGLTETTPILTVLDHQTHLRAIEEGETHLLGSAGKPVAQVWLRIVDADGEDVPAGEAGEVLARGPNVMKGYLNQPEETARVLVDGWLHTGDIGRMDEEGYLYLLDRTKDMIVSGGENIYSTEVEAVLYRHPGVGEAAVIGVPDAKMGESLLAVIVAKPGAAPDADGLIEFCRELIGGYKIPRRFVFAEAMPKNAMGKILKSELRRMHG